MIRLGSAIYHLQQSVASRLQRRAIRRAMCRPTPADPIFVFGLSRSGSTWLQETIAAWPGTVSLFEPIHAKIPETAGAYTLEDWRPADQAMSDSERAVMTALLRGEILARRVLAGTATAPARVPQGEIRRFCIKFIHCNNGMPRMVRDLCLRYRPLAILRHPCAHVASWKRLKWTENFGELAGRFNVLLSGRPELREVVSGLSTPLEWMAGSWCLGNYVPLTVDPAGRWTVVRYEELQTEPDRVLAEIFATWGEPTVPAEVSGAVGKASRTTWRKGQPPGAVATADSWRKEVSAEECKTVFDVCARFGVDVDYDGYRVR